VGHKCTFSEGSPVVVNLVNSGELLPLSAQHQQQHQEWPPSASSSVQGRARWVGRVASRHWRPSVASIASMKARGGPQKLRFAIASCTGEDSVRPLFPSLRVPHGELAVTPASVALHGAGLPRERAAVSQPPDARMAGSQVRDRGSSCRRWKRPAGSTTRLLSQTCI
jgi:hypothetical protein